ncbi:hypothetical protein GQ457_06G001320 [Hibiscus cannabinus]
MLKSNRKFGRQYCIQDDETAMRAVADIVNGTSRMRSARERHHHSGSELFRTVSHYSFFDGEPRWPLPSTA